MNTTKQQAMDKFGYTSIDDFDTLLLDLEIEPETEELTPQQMDAIAHWIANHRGLPTSVEESITDDGILAVVENTGVELDVVMEAANHLESLEALVRWVEEYKACEAEALIKESAKQQFEIDQLRKKEAQLSDRLQSAISKKSPDVNAIKSQLGIATPQNVTQMGKWNGKAHGEGEPDFLKNARVLFNTTRQ